MTAAKGFVVPAGGGKHHASPTPGRFNDLKLSRRVTKFLREPALPPLHETARREWSPQATDGARQRYLMGGRV
jgi:hypothetical protein